MIEMVMILIFLDDWRESADSLYDKYGQLDVSNINAPVTTTSFVNSGSEPYYARIR